LSADLLFFDQLRKANLMENKKLNGACGNRREP